MFLSIRQTITQRGHFQLTVNKRLISTSLSKRFAAAEETAAEEPEDPLAKHSESDRIPEAAMPLATAIHLIKSKSLGYESRKIAVNLLCKTSDGSVRDLRGAIVLPHRFLDTKVCIISSSPEKQEEGRRLGASIVGGPELLELMKQDKLTVDRLIVTPEIMPLVTPMARLLGPLGLMPTVKKGTVTEDIEVAMQQQADAVMFKCDHNGLISAVIGKAGMPSPAIEENVSGFIDKLKQMKKGKQKKFVSHIWINAEPLVSDESEGSVDDGLIAEMALPDVFVEKTPFKC